MVLRNILKRLPWEAIVWVIGLALLIFADIGDSHFTLCPLSNAGIDFCPGCGLGRSINLLFQGEISASLQAHPLGIFAVIVLSFRILNLTKLHLHHYGKSN